MTQDFFQSSQKKWHRVIFASRWSKAKNHQADLKFAVSGGKGKREGEEQVLPSALQVLASGQDNAGLLYRLFARGQMCRTVQSGMQDSCEVL